jgi:Lipocalin-like domain
MSDDICVPTECPESEDTVIGCWMMVEAWNINNPGDPKTYPWGNPPLGYWVYDTAGNVSVQISMNPALPNLGAGTSGNGWWTDTPPPVNEMVNTFNNYMAYFGTYVVDYNQGQIIQNVTTDVLRQYEYPDNTQVRPFALVDGNLIIGDQTTYYRRFVKVARIVPL